MLRFDSRAFSRHQGILTGCLIVTLALNSWACSSIPPRPASGCTRVSGIPGPEDFEAEPGPGPARILVSSQNRRTLDEAGEFARQGAIYRVAIDGSTPPDPLPITERDGLPFHPHGISIVMRAPFPLLYVINHPVHHSHAIEIFEIRTRELRFVRRLRSPLLISPNDLVALPNGHIYVTNDHGTAPGLKRNLEDLLALKWSSVVMFDGLYWRTVATDIAFANGIAASSSADRIFVASSRDRGLYIFARQPDGQLSPSPVFLPLDSGADNLLWEKPDVLNVAGHPSPLAFLSHASDPESLSPSEVFRIPTDTLRPVRIYRDNGSQISASSTALVAGTRLIIAQVFEDFLLNCEAPPGP